MEFIQLGVLSCNNRSTRERRIGKTKTRSSKSTLWQIVYVVYGITKTYIFKLNSFSNFSTNLDKFVEKAGKLVDNNIHDTLQTTFKIQGCNQCYYSIYHV